MRASDSDWFGDPADKRERIDHRVESLSTDEPIITSSRNLPRFWQIRFAEYRGCSQQAAIVSSTS